MRFTSLTTLSVFVATALGATIASLNKRDDIVSLNDITAPTTGTVIQPAQTFDFSYSLTVDCADSVYIPVTVWLLASEPTTSSINSTVGYKFPPGSYLYYLGSFIQPTSPGIPDPVGVSPLPSSFVMPLLPIATGSDIYLATIQAERCAKETEYGLSSVQIQYGS